MSSFGWSLQQKFRVPGVENATHKFIFNAFAFGMVALIYLLISLWFLKAIPTFFSAFDEVQAERWRNKAAFVGRACFNSTAHFVVLDCNQTKIALTRDDLQEAVERAMSHFKQESGPISWFGRLVGCGESSTFCMSLHYYLFDLLTQRPVLSLLFGWCTTTLFLASLAWKPAARAWKDMRTLMPTTIQEEFESLQKHHQEQYVASLIRNAVEDRPLPVMHPFVVPPMLGWTDPADPPLPIGEEELDSFRLDSAYEQSEGFQQPTESTIRSRAVSSQHSKRDADSVDL